MRAFVLGCLLAWALWLGMGRPDLSPALGQGQVLAGAAVAQVQTAIPPPPPITLNDTPVAAPMPAPMPASGGQAELWPGAMTCYGYHAGATDWCGFEGQAVAAPASGTLASIGSYTDPMKYGAYVMIETPAGLEIYLGHLNHEDVAPGLSVGQWVEAGTVVGYLSEFAYSTPHTHVQLRRGGALAGPDVWWAEWEGR